MKTITLFTGLLMLLVFPKIKAQELIAPQGGSSVLPSIQLDYTIGEVAVSSGVADELILKEGYLQPQIRLHEIFTAIRNSSFTEMQMKVYPNPTTNICRLVFSVPLSENAKLKLYNLQYNLISVTSLPNQATDFTLNMQNLGAGAYILNLEDPKLEYFTSYRIIKIH